MPTALIDSEQAAATIEDYVVNEIDKTAKKYVQQSCKQTDEAGDDHHPGVIARNEFFQGFLHFHIVTAFDCRWSRIACPSLFTKLLGLLLYFLQSDRKFIHNGRLQECIEY